MKPILLFIMPSCPYCKQALKWIDELKHENGNYTDLEIMIIDETRQSELANQYDYYLVPTFYVNNVKVHEGAATKEIIRNVFNEALE